MTLIEMNQVSKVYGAIKNRFNAVNNISLTLNQGEFLGIMGPSGAGKSTILNMASTIDFPTSGTVKIQNQLTTSLNEKDLEQLRKEKMGFIFQDFGLLDNLTVFENIELPLLAKRTGRKTINSEVLKITKLLFLNDVLDSYPDELSVGQKQRVAAARAIIKKPEVIFADEPTGSLDSRSATELLQFLSGLNQQEKTTIMMVTHDPFTASYCQRIVFIKDGQIFSQINRAGTRQEFFEKILNMQAAIGGGQKNVF